jgi:transcriptional regulator with XRE-family HTH domain
MDELVDELGDEQLDDGVGELVDGASWDCLANWSQAEREYWWMGPFGGGIPGLVRRIRRILDVSQRGLAALLGVSQSVVARWETGRTSPRAEVVEDLLRRARLEVRLVDRHGERVAPMRGDGARTRGGSRFPAHTDLRARGWWVPRALRAMTSVEAFSWVDRSRRDGVPAIRCRTSRRLKRQERWLYGVPDDHPAWHQLVAEVRFLDEQREDRRPRTTIGQRCVAPWDSDETRGPGRGADH